MAVGSRGFPRLFFPGRLVLSRQAAGENKHFFPRVLSCHVVRVPVERTLHVVDRKKLEMRGDLFLACKTYVHTSTRVPPLAGAIDVHEYLENIMAKDREIAELKAEVSDGAV